MRRLQKQKSKVFRFIFAPILQMKIKMLTTISNNQKQQIYVYISRVIFKAHALNVFILFIKDIHLFLPIQGNENEKTKKPKVTNNIVYINNIYIESQKLKRNKILFNC